MSGGESEFWVGFGTTALIQGFLYYLVVPLKVLSHFLDPSRVLIDVSSRDKGYTVGRISDNKLVIAFHSETHLSIKSDPGTCSCLLRQNDRDFGRFGQNYRSEGQ